ncbi:hypothetical protein [Hymenobacter jejuensis]|uniref:Nucleotide-diphospho-sugar transferase domain-containing protein n=1 Tax=Hymenobacter jejuensis TaxID=2502781 RepID=A0A5B7ZXV6_9BACT|nr:hypothetical protein [Hymenobacter jejuensis]QDA59343.1 hypothetical protein FHG12_04145 [Hymenobacter jejuensis]
MHLLVLQSFGKESEYRRALLTILSFWAWYSGPAERVRTVLFTDQPEFFKPLVGDLPVEYVQLTPEKIKVMRGGIDFLHRMKIAVIEEAFHLHPGADILYVDSDTFFTRDALTWMESFRPGRSFMHLLEYQFGECRDMPLPAGETFRAYLNYLENNKLHTSKGEEQFGAHSESWNAGVMGLPAKASAWISDVYAITEQSYPSTLNHASEQYAFSLVLKTRSELLPCDQYVYHYWYRVKKQIVDLLLAEAFSGDFQRVPLADKLQLAKQLTQQLPETFEHHILMLRDNAVQAFTDNRFTEGYRHAFRALSKSPFNPQFIKDVLYHAKRHLASS